MRCTPRSAFGLALCGGAEAAAERGELVVVPAALQHCLARGEDAGWCPAEGNLAMGAEQPIGTAVRLLLASGFSINHMQHLRAHTSGCSGTCSGALPRAVVTWGAQALSPGAAVLGAGTEPCRQPCWESSCCSQSCSS